MATQVLSRKTGVIVGDDVLKLFNYAQEKQFAIPAIVRSPSSGSYFQPLGTIWLTQYPERYLIFHGCRLSRGGP